MTPAAGPSGRGDGATPGPAEPWNTLWQRIKCRLGMHWLFRKQQVSEASDLIGCACCGREWGMNHDVRAFVPWDDDLERMYQRHGVVVDHDVQPPGIAPRGYRRPAARQALARPRTERTP